MCLLWEEWKNVQKRVKVFPVFFFFGMYTVFTHLFNEKLHLKCTFYNNNCFLSHLLIPEMPNAALEIVNYAIGVLFLNIVMTILNIYLSFLFHHHNILISKMYVRFGPQRESTQLAQ
ncbi:hypothetical protein GOODEAATRI_022845 [Goodea atripinnis]|uniref:Uncharacterized protein n=1 Tax=Goodea atripinnis TaxID=208336 RepID=A0ABV0NG37_9TELE